MVGARFQQGHVVVGVVVALLCVRAAIGFGGGAVDSRVDFLEEIVYSSVRRSMMVRYPRT